MTDDPDHKKAKNKLSREDRRLWARVMENVRPLPGRNLDNHHEYDEPMAPARPAEKPPFFARFTEPMHDRTESVRPDSQSTDMDRRTADRLRRGKMPIDVVLDLHGLRQHEAQAQLSRTILNAYTAGRRCLLIITGKGSRSSPEDEPGVLRRMLPVWLGRADLKPLILAVEQAKQKDGGSGAFYVYLRRQR